MKTGTALVLGRTESEAGDFRGMGVPASGPETTGHVARNKMILLLRRFHMGDSLALPLTHR